MDKKTERALARAVQNLDMAERDLGRIKPTTSIQSITNIQKRLTRAEEGLADIPDGTEGKDEALSRLDQLTMQYNAALAKAESAVAEREENIETLKSLAAEGYFEEVRLFLNAANDLAGEVKFMDYKAPPLSSPHHDMADSYARFAAAYPPTYQRVQELRDKFGDFVAKDLGEYGTSNLETLIWFGGKDFDTAWEKLSAFGEEALAFAEGELSTAATLADAALAADQPGDLLYNEEITGRQTYVENLIAIYEARADAEPALTKKYQALKKRLESTVGAAQEKALVAIVERNNPVADRFMDPDRATIEEMLRYRWGEAYPDDVVLQVRIPNEQWIRRSEPGWLNGVLVLLEYSIVTAYVIVEEDDGLASSWGMVVEKDHLQNDEITASFGRLRTGKLDPRYVIKQDKL